MLVCGVELGVYGECGVKVAGLVVCKARLCGDAKEAGGPSGK